ncbi:MAG: hypothetical protein AAF203_05100 [Pseudomonadota bacterium]
MARKKAKSSGSGDSDAPAIPASLKKFRQSPEIEGFYRFIYENDLRTEAFAIVDDISQKRLAAKSKKKSK